MDIIEITPRQLGFGYMLLIFPLAILLWYRIPLLGKTLMGVVRMTVQLIFVGLYLHVIFEYNNGRVRRCICLNCSCGLKRSVPTTNDINFSI